MSIKLYVLILSIFYVCLSVIGVYRRSVSYLMCYVMFQIEPYVMVRYPRVNRTQGARYEGYVPDLVEKLSKLVGFDYEIKLARDGKYGHRRPDGSWDGMIGELLRSVSGN